MIQVNGRDGDGIIFERAIGRDVHVQLKDGRLIRGRLEAYDQLARARYIRIAKA